MKDKIIKLMVAIMFIIITITALFIAQLVRNGGLV